MKRISVVGLGYIGLPTSIVAAQNGYEVFGFDIDYDKVHRINSGDSTIFEPEIADRLWSVLSRGSFKAYTDLQYADCFIIAVPTPFNPDKTADLSYVFKAGDFIAKRLMPGNLVILESTVPVETTERLAAKLEDASGLRLGVDFFVAYCPERVLPGKIFKELIDNDRVIGGVCQKSCELARQFYGKFVKGFLHITDDKTAEMVKLVENSSRDVQIAFANQVAAMCTTTGIDPFQVIDLANRHPRVKILSPGCGVGGHCIKIDPYFLIERFPQDTLLLKAAREVNDTKPQQIIEKVLHKVSELTAVGIEKPTVLALGLTFKADVDDYRESPALKIALELNKQKETMIFLAYDHNLNKDVLLHFGFEYIRDLWKSIKAADIILILVKHKEFCFIREEMVENKIVIDPCGLLHDIYLKKSKDLLEGAVKFNCTTDTEPIVG